MKITLRLKPRGRRPLSSKVGDSVRAGKPDPAQDEPREGPASLRVRRWVGREPAPHSVRAALVSAIPEVSRPPPSIRTAARAPESMRLQKEVAAPPKRQQLMKQPGGNSVVLLGSCVIVVCSTQSDLPMVNALSQGFEQLLRSYPKIGVCSVIELGSTRPLAEVRSAFARVMERFTNEICGSAIVYEGNGFKATAVRSVVTAVNLASAASHPNKVFGDVSSAFSWLMPLLPRESGMSSSHLVQCVRELRVPTP